MRGVDIVSGITLSVIGGLGRAASTPRSEYLINSSVSKCSFSSLANQLEGSSRRAEERDKNSSWLSLRAFTSAVSEDLHEYRNGKQIERDSEIPKTDDPILLERARQATSYLHNLNRDSNPFKGLAPDQLELIAHDVDGPYTKNERHAAMREQYRQDQCWRQRVIAAASQEYLATGKRVNFLKEILRYVEELPPLDRAGFPENYEQELEQKIAREIEATPADTSMGLRNGDIFLQVMIDAWSHEKRVSSDRIEKERIVHDEAQVQ